MPPHDYQDSECRNHCRSYACHFFPYPQCLCLVISFRNYLFFSTPSRAEGNEERRVIRLAGRVEKLGAVWGGQGPELAGKPDPIVRSGALHGKPGNLVGRMNGTTTKESSIGDDVTIH